MKRLRTEAPGRAGGSGARRLRHPGFLVFLSAGVVGSGLNVGTSALLFHVLGWSPLLAFFLGTIANELFHHLCYHCLHVNQEIRMRTALPVQLALYLAAAGLAVLPLRALMHLLGLGFLPAVLCAAGLLAAVNSAVNRIATLASSRMADVEYQEMGESFYDDQTDAAKVGRIRAWFHRSRYERLEQFVAEHYRPGMAIADLGCGNCWWNRRRIPVTGVDINEKMLQWARDNGRVQRYRVCGDLSGTGLAGSGFDVVVMSEVLEHLLGLEDVLGEVRRILKDDGVFLVTVPYDIFLGPFFILFNVNCLYQGVIKGSRYHRVRCGHVNHFTKKRLRGLLAAGGFEIVELFVVNRLSLYAAARKRSG